MITLCNLGPWSIASLTSSPTAQLSDLDTGYSDFIPKYFLSDKGPPGIQESRRMLAMYHLYTFSGTEGNFLFYIALKTLKNFKRWN